MVAGAQVVASSREERKKKGKSGPQLTRKCFSVVANQHILLHLFGQNLVMQLYPATQETQDSIRGGSWLWSPWFCLCRGQTCCWTWLPSQGPDFPQLLVAPNKVCEQRPLISPNQGNSNIDTPSSHLPVNELLPGILDRARRYYKYWWRSLLLDLWIAARRRVFY